MDLQLYYKPECPFCVRVLGFLKRKKIDIGLKNIHEEENYKYLIENGGQDQVPCLFIDGKPLYESLDIIDFLTEKFVR